VTKEKILVVDDEPSNRRVLRTLLSELGYAVREAGDGQDALREIGREAPDIILTDLMMPRKNGYELCREVKGDPRTRLIPVVVLTTLEALPDKLRAVELGADDFLSKPYEILELKARVRSLLSLKRFTDDLEHASNVLSAIATVVESRDRYTGDHCRRLADYSEAVGRALGLGEEDLGLLRMGGTLHDLGKIGVPDAILNKPGKLSDDEYALMKTHAALGGDFLSGMRSLHQVVPMVRHHHEKLDGSGYPDGLTGKEIPLLVRITSVVDVYDALTTRRSYKEPFPPERALAMLRDDVRRGWWDKDVVEALAARLAAAEPGLRAPGIGANVGIKASG
jgi:putative two-component system response regulator